VVGISHPNGSEAVQFRPADGLVHSLTRQDLSYAIVTVEDRDTTRIDDGVGARDRFHHAALYASVVPRQPHHTVRLVPPQVGSDEAVRN
jgi:hypothetical protein